MTKTHRPNVELMTKTQTECEYDDRCLVAESVNGQNEQKKESDSTKETMDPSKSAEKTERFQ